MRSTRPKENDRLQQARLAGRVGSDDEVGAGAERGVERAVAAQVLRGESVQQVRGPGRYDVVRTGMTTWT